GMYRLSTRSLTSELGTLSTSRCSLASTGRTASNHVSHVASETCERIPSTQSIHSCSAFVTSASASPDTVMSTLPSTSVDNVPGPKPGGLGTPGKEGPAPVG